MIEEEGYLNPEEKTDSYYFAFEAATDGDFELFVFYVNQLIDLNFEIIKGAFFYEKIEFLNMLKNSDYKNLLIIGVIPILTLIYDLKEEKLNKSLKWIEENMDFINKNRNLNEEELSSFIDLTSKMVSDGNIFMFKECMKFYIITDQNIINLAFENQRIKFLNWLKDSEYNNLLFTNLERFYSLKCKMEIQRLKKSLKWLNKNSSFIIRLE